MLWSCGATPSGASDSDESGDSEGAFDCESAITEIQCNQMASNERSCVWGRVQLLGDPASCGQALETGGRCLEVAYQGAGCGVSSTCWQDFDWVPNSFYKLEDDGTAWIMTAPVCSYWPTDSSWQQCQFDWDMTTMEPIVDPAVCGCLCE
jgi:hypothetical protein